MKYNVNGPIKNNTKEINTINTIGIRNIDRMCKEYNFNAICEDGMIVEVRDEQTNKILF